MTREDSAYAQLRADYLALWRRHERLLVDLRAAGLDELAEAHRLPEGDEVTAPTLRPCPRCGAECAPEPRSPPVQ